MNFSARQQKHIQIMREAGLKISRIMAELAKGVKVGVNLLAIEEKANKLIKQAGGSAGFKKVPGYNWATCLNINEGIVHGIPYNYNLKAGDILSIDTGLFYKGFHTDMCWTQIVPTQNQEPKSKTYKEKRLFLEAGRRALREAVKVVKPGNRVGHISKTIQQVIEGQNYTCSTSLTGHGVGKQLHEAPGIPCVLRREIEKTPLLKKGMTLAIEVIYMMGKAELIILADGWTIATKDGKISAVFEETVAVTESGAEVLTPLPF